MSCLSPPLDGVHWLLLNRTFNQHVFLHIYCECTHSQHSHKIKSCFFGPGKTRFLLELTVLCTARLSHWVSSYFNQHDLWAITGGGISFVAHRGLLDQLDNIITCHLLAHSMCVSICSSTVMDGTGLLLACRRISLFTVSHWPPRTVFFQLDVSSLTCPGSMNPSITIKLLWKGLKPSNVIIWINGDWALVMDIQMPIQETHSLSRRQMALWNPRRC